MFFRRNGPITWNFLTGEPGHTGVLQVGQSLPRYRRPQSFGWLSQGTLHQGCSASSIHLIISVGHNVVGGGIGKLCTNKCFTWYSDTPAGNDLLPSEKRLSSLGALPPPPPMLKLERALSKKVETQQGSFPGFLFSLSRFQRHLSRGLGHHLKWTEEGALDVTEPKRGKDVFLTIFNNAYHCYRGAGELSLIDLMASWA